MLRNYNRKTAFVIAPKKELALLSNKDRTERRRLQKKVWFDRWKAKQALAKKTAQPTTTVTQKLEETDDSWLNKTVLGVVIELKQS